MRTDLGELSMIGDGAMDAAAGAAKKAANTTFTITIAKASAEAR